MSRILRGVWSRRGPLATLAAMTAVVVAGTVATLALARATDTTALVVAPLLLLAVVAIPAIGAEVAESRREEVALARLRGIGGLRLGSMILAEPAMSVLVGVLAGIPAGRGVAGLLAVRWDGDAADQVALTSQIMTRALLVALAGLVVAGISALRALREPLAGQLRARNRPRAATTLAIFGTLVVVIGAGVAVQRSRVDVDGDPDVLIQLAPALVGLACALAAGWVVGRVGRVGAVATASSGFVPFLAMRRLGRSGDLVAGVRLVIAAAVVGGLALSASASVAGWLDEQARTSAGAEWAVPTEADVDETVALTEELDPEGEHLMAALVVPEESRLSERRAFVDTRRFEAVSGEFYAGTRLAVDGLADLRTADLSEWTFTSSSLKFGMVATVQEAPEPSPTVQSTQGVEVNVVYQTRRGTTREARTIFFLRTQGARADGQVRLPGCAEGCRLVTIEVARLRVGAWFRRYDTTPFEVLVDTLTLEGRDLTQQPWWAPAEVTFADYPAEKFDPSRPVTATAQGLLLRPLPSGNLDLSPGSQTLPVLVAGTTPEQVADPSSRYLIPDVRRSVEALPFVGTEGFLADLSTATIGARHRVPSSEMWVLADEDTPSDMLAAVAEATGGEPRQWVEVSESLKVTSGAAISLTHGTTAVACGLVAFLALAAGAARTARSQRREVASYRLLGVDLGRVRGAGRLEVGMLAGLTATFVAAGVWLVVRLLLDGGALVSLTPAQLVPDPSPRWMTWLVPVLLAALAVALVGGASRRVRTDRTAPAVLREEESR